MTILEHCRGFLHRRQDITAGYFRVHIRYRFGSLACLPVFAKITATQAAPVCKMSMNEEAVPNKYHTCQATPAIHNTAVTCLLNSRRGVGCAGAIYQVATVGGRSLLRPDRREEWGRDARGEVWSVWVRRQGTRRRGKLCAGAYRS